MRHDLWFGGEKETLSMKNLSLALFSLLICSIGFSQTKLIAHKSHSGNSENFILALTSDDFGLTHSNFGEAPDRYVLNAQLDSVIFINRNQVVLVTSFYHEEETDKKDKKNESGWEPAHETVYGHPLFSHQHSLDSIKMVLKRDYHFKNDIHEVIFLGYDNGEKIKDSEKENKLFPVGSFFPKGPFPFLAVLTLTGFALLARSKNWMTATI
ncbi:MAG: hypothetical protein ACI9CP_001606 [Cryomorphaceae bacterium]